MSQAELLAAHALGLRWRDIPLAVRESAKIFLLDTIAVGVAGVGAPFADQVLGVASAGASGQARVFGRAHRLSPAAAAFANAYQIHAQEFDCVHEPAVLHPYSAPLGALAAELATSPADGETFGAALVAGVDIAVALGLASHGSFTFFRPATAGLFGATAAVARLRGLSQPQTVAAFGHALAFASGTMQAHVEGTPGLPLQVAAAARHAILAVDLAQAGVPGANFSIEGPFGYLALFGGITKDPQSARPVLETLQGGFAITGLSHKPFPTGRAAHGGIGAVQALSAGAGVAADDILRLRYVAPHVIQRLVGRPARIGMSVNYARLCLPYLAAHTVRHGTVGLTAFSTEALSNPATLSLAARIDVQIDDNPDLAAFAPAILYADMLGGRTIEVDVPAVLGSPAAPLDEKARMAKVAECLSFGGSTLRAETLADRVHALETERDVGALLTLANPT